VARLQAAPEEVRSLRSRLSGSERQRAERFRFERDRRRYVVARARLRELLGARLGVHPEAVEIEYGRNGKPRLARGEWHFSVSHSDDVALYGFSSREVGVDIEAVRPIAQADAIAAQFFSPGEYTAYCARRSTFLECWTRMEALAKASGEGLAGIPLDASPWSLKNFSPLAGFVAALACRNG